MKKTKYEKFRGYIEKWMKVLWLGWWSINLNLDCGEPREAKIGSGCVLATCDATWGYLTATITVNEKALESVEDSEIEYYALHELMHIFLSELSTPGKREHEERVATLLARSFISTRDKKS